jgi:hypothetical protein
MVEFEPDHCFSQSERLGHGGRGGQRDDHGHERDEDWNNCNYRNRTSSCSCRNCIGFTLSAELDRRFYGSTLGDHA